MERADLERRVHDLRWPEPTPDLRGRVLSAAVPTAQRIRWSDRVWFSGAWRAAAVAILVSAIVFEALWGTPDVTRFVPSPQALVEAHAIEDTSREIGLPADLAASLANRALTPPPAPENRQPLDLQAFTMNGSGR